MPKLKEITELVDADPNLGEQIAVFEETDKSNELYDTSQPDISSA